VSEKWAAAKAQWNNRPMLLAELENMPHGMVSVRCECACCSALSERVREAVERVWRVEQKAFYQQYQGELCFAHGLVTVTSVLANALGRESYLAHVHGGEPLVDQFWLAAVKNVEHCLNSTLQFSHQFDERKLHG
jgi:hypothetical protein